MDSHAWDERYASSDLVWSPTPNQFVESEVAGLPPGSAVDLAAGEGRNAIWLAGRGWRVVALDFSQVGLDKGRRLAEGLELGGSIEWVCADATTWVAPAPVDLVVVAYLQLPAGERRAALVNALTSLRPGGTLLVVAHDSTNLAEGTGGPQDPTVLMSADDVLGDLSSAAPDGYDVLRAGRVARTVPVADEHGGEATRTAWDCLVRVQRR